MKRTLLHATRIFGLYCGYYEYDWELGLPKDKQIWCFVEFPRSLDVIALTTWICFSSPEVLSSLVGFSIKPTAYISQAYNNRQADLQKLLLDVLKAYGLK